jgi:two-component system response regulator AtoC
VQSADTTTRLSPDAGNYELLVAGDGRLSLTPLPKHGELLIGRGPEADVSLLGEGVSRRHAVLRVKDGTFTLEDLDSSNGTMLRGSRMPPRTPTAVAAGESVMAGEFVLVVRPRHTRATPRRVLSHEYFEARLGEQCDRAAEHDHAAFYVVGVRAEAEAGGDPAELIAAELEPSDVLSRLAPNEWGVLLLEDSESGARALAAEIEASLGAAGFRAGARLVAYPRDGISPGALLASIGRAFGDDDGGLGASPIVRSPAMEALYRETLAVARGTISVLILGETGVGKDVLAKSIHDRSERANGPFLRLNCAALPEQLLESELFGYERGAFTGASQAKLGLLQAADGGSVFLDEIGEFPVRLQAKLLQALETREILPLGGTKAKRVDVRFLAATNRDLEAAAFAGTFRNDLYYRVAGYTALIPPLRERREDILPLAQEFLRRVAAQAGAPSGIRIREDAAVRLLDYAWPGNVRELRNIVERAFVLAAGKSIGPEHLPLEKMRSVLLVQQRPTSRPAEGASDVPVTDLTAEELDERNRILEALAQSAGNQSKAAALLGLSRSTLLNRLDAYRIRRPRKRPG